MAVTLTVDQLRTAVRYGSSTDETAELTRVLDYATEAIDRHLGDAYAGTPAVVVNEAAVRLAAYLLDQPNAGRGDGFANALRNSGAARMLLPYREHRLGTTAEATATTDDSGSAPTPDPGSAGVDQIARDAAAAAQAAANANAAALATHTANASAHHVKTPAYVLPAAAPGTRGGVQAVTNAIIDAGTSTGIFGWALSHVKRVINAVVPAWARDDTTAIPAAKLTNVPPASVNVTRHTITFDASTYSYETEANTGVSGGVSYLTASYPSGLTKAVAEGAVKVGYLDVDPHQSTRHEGPMVERTSTIMRGHTEGASVRFRDSDLRLELLGIELANANQRDTWRLRLGVLG